MPQMAGDALCHLHQLTSLNLFYAGVCDEASLQVWTAPDALDSSAPSPSTNGGTPSTPIVL